MLLRSDTDSVCLELMPLGEANTALRKTKSKVRPETDKFSLNQPLQTPEEEAKIKAKKQLRSDIQVYCAMLIILLGAAAVTLLKIYLVERFGPGENPNPTFRPRPQVTGSSIMYTGNGFLPCNGFVPCQPDSLPPWKNAARLEGSMEGWRDEWDGYQGVYKGGKLSG